MERPAEALKFAGKPDGQHLEIALIKSFNAAGGTVDQRDQGRWRGSARQDIIFAKNQAHADFISERFNVRYPHLRGHFAQVITHKVEYGQNLIDKFSIKESDPHIAISVDMLDTGIEVPEVVNLVFFKLLRSKTKFWQMLGRGTRLCKDPFAPGEGKTTFMVFDFCQNLEYFNQPGEVEIGRSTPSLSKRLFRNRLEILTELDRANGLNNREFDPSTVQTSDDPDTEKLGDSGEAEQLVGDTGTQRGDTGPQNATVQKPNHEIHRTGNREVRAGIAELLRARLGR